ncbi:hypothetical protein [Cryptosporangium sp. NPDC048952]|uniref:hypothetical protein n=1 Tax=Cryptosporangium sp. NPDC048952 TaxID=3363961 RepID=UPI00371B5F33
MSSTLGLATAPSPVDRRAVRAGPRSRRFGAALPAEDAETLRAAAALTEPWLLHHQDPFSLIHGDYRLGNVALSLAVPDRRAHEDSLVAAYHAARTRPWAAPPPPTRCSCR